VARLHSRNPSASGMEEPLEDGASQRTRTEVRIGCATFVPKPIADTIVPKTDLRCRRCREAFGTEVVADVIKKILAEGEFQLTTAERREKVEKKRAEIINYLHKYFVDPKTGHPHPVRVDRGAGPSDSHTAMLCCGSTHKYGYTHTPTLARPLP